jgi:glyoxylate/hydroxypyruvate reductase A
MGIVIVMPGRDEDAARLRVALQRLDSDLEVWIQPDIPDPGRVVSAVTWKHSPGELGRFPNLRAAISYGAGVEHLLDDPSIPAGVTIARTVDEGLIRDMVEFVVGRVIEHRRGFRGVAADQRTSSWVPRRYPPHWDVLILGAGRLGGAAAEALHHLGHRVTVWSRSGRAPVHVSSIVGREALLEALPGADAVVCLLPLTGATRDLIDASFLARMKPGSLLLNVGRGAHLVESDLLPALDSGRPAVAVLDVFTTEPLPPDHPFWGHPRVVVSPHVASLTDPEGVAGAILANHRRAVAGEPLCDAVDVDRGY